MRSGIAAVSIAGTFDLFEYRLRKVGPQWIVYLVGDELVHGDYQAAQAACEGLKARGYVDGDEQR